MTAIPIIKTIMCRCKILEKIKIFKNFNISKMDSNSLKQIL